VTVPALGVVFRPQNSPEQLRAVAEAADASGVDMLWLWEDCFREGGISTAAAALAWTSRVRVGIGLLPVPLRNVALTAMELATLERLFPDRLEIGIGHGVQEWMGQVGARAQSPLTLLREYTVALKRLLAGELVTTSGRYVNLDAVRLDWPPPAASRAGPRPGSHSARWSSPARPRAVFSKPPCTRGAASTATAPARRPGPSTPAPRDRCRSRAGPGRAAPGWPAPSRSAPRCAAAPGGGRCRRVRGTSRRARPPPC